MDEITLARLRDPGRGDFCAATKSGIPLPFPPTRREPIANRETNPRGVRHPYKTLQDSLDVEKRPRVHAARKRVEAMKAARPR